MTLAWSKNKKGAALTYAIMVLLLLATVVVAMTALSTASYTDAVLAVSDDQSYYYAKSIGLAVKEQFKDGYNIARILTALDEAEESGVDDPKVTGTFAIANGDGDLVNGTVQIRYARNEDDKVNDHIIEVRAACVVNNSVAVVTSIFSCEDDSEDETNHMASALTDYDVILTDTENLDFNFSQASEGVTGTSSLSVYVYAGEDDNVDNPEFSLRLNMAGKLTTTGKTKIVGRVSNKSSTTKEYHYISGNLTAYGDVALTYIGVEGTNGVHCDGDVKLNAYSFVRNDIYARGTVTINDPGVHIHSSLVDANGLTKALGDYHSARNVYAQGDVTLNARSVLTGSIFTHGNVTINGYGGNPYSENLINHFGNTYVGENIYSEGTVTITKGAVVKGNVIANGDIKVQRGAIVLGNVQSVNGNIYVRGGAVGGQVNCPKGTLTLNNSGDPLTADTYAAGGSFLSEVDYGTGIIIYGGIGLFQSGTIYKHTCNKLQTTDCDMISLVRGNLYVENPTSGDYTPLMSIWAHNAIYLKNSTAHFNNSSDPHAVISYHGTNTAGNPYIYIVELNQNRDLYGNEEKPYVRMWGAHIVNLNLGESKYELYDGYLFDGWVGNVNGRCLHMADMQMDGYVYASQFLEIWGTAGDYNFTNYNRPGHEYTYANNGLAGGGITYVPYYITLEVACKIPSYRGKLTEETRVGCIVGQYTEVYGLINVGSEAGSPQDAYVMIGNGTLPGTKFYGGMNAYVGNVWISGNARLSTWKDASGSGTLSAATILAEITGGDNPNYGAPVKGYFYVQNKTGDNGDYRYGSMIQVKGNAWISGCVGTFEHFRRSSGDSVFHNDDTARFQGVFRSDGATVELRGTNCFSDVEIINASSTTSLVNSLSLSSLKTNGNLKLNSSYTLTASGDVYAKKLTTQIQSVVNISGNFTIEQCNQTTVQPQRSFTVGKDFYLGQGNVKFTSSSHKVMGKVQAAAGDIEISGGSIIYGAVTPANKTLTVSGGNLKGDFSTGTFSMSSGVADPASGRIFGKTKQYTHTGGTIKKADIIVSGTTSTSVKIESVSGSAPTAESVFINADAGGATVTGGSKVNYAKGALRTKLTATIAGGFQMGISVSEGNLIIGSTSSTSDSYKIGYGISSDNPDADGYCVIYAKGTISWGYGARSAYNNAGEQGRADLPRLSAGGNITMGSESYYVPGAFSGVCSDNGTVNIYVEKVDGVSAKSTSYVHVSNYLGLYPDNKKNTETTETHEWDSGFKVTAGDAYIYGKTGAEYMRGHIQASANIHIERPINAEGCKIKCRDIYNLSNIKDVSGCKPISLYLLAPSNKDSEGFYELTSGIAGDFSIEGNLKYSSPVKVKGELWVNGLFKYNGSLENVVCLGGLYCLNSKINVTSDFVGNVHLPNVTTLALNADIGVNAPKVTSFELNIDITHSLNLASCDSLVVASGRTVGGSVIIKDTGKIVNNGTIDESVKCGQYEGSGVVGKDLIALSSGVTNTITGRVDGNIWTNGSLEINTTQRLGYTNTYIYAKKDIKITNAQFNPGMSYILSMQGNILLTECAGYIPSVWNMGGTTRFVNKSESKRAQIKSVLTYGTWLDFGNNKNEDYQTVTGDIEWHGIYDGRAVEVHEGGHTVIDGIAHFYGTGNVWLGTGTYNIIKAKFTGTLTSSGGTVKQLYVDSPVESASIASKITDKGILWGTNDTTEYTLTGGATGEIHFWSVKTVYIDSGTYTGSLFTSGCKTVEINTVYGSNVTIKSADEFRVNSKVNGNLYLYNIKKSLIFADIGGFITHTAPAPSSWSDMNLIALGKEDTLIKVAGNINAHGRVVDNCEQTGNGRTINVKGAYYVDLKKENGTTTDLNFTTECGGNATFISGKTGGNNWDVTFALNIAGRLVVETIYDESNSKSAKIGFTKTVKANAIVANSNVRATSLSNHPSSYLLCYSTSNESSVSTTACEGKDRRFLTENMWTYEFAGNLYKERKQSSTERDLITFKGEVHVAKGNDYNGTIFAANTTFKADTYCAGQVGLYYCETYATGWESDANHCTNKNSSNNTDLTVIKDHGMFFHTDSNVSGENYFAHVLARSNVAIYKGTSHLFKSTEFRGTTYAGSSEEASYNGHRSTKLFYFGESVELYGTSCISSNMQGSVYVAAARTIVWVKTGALVVRDGSYIGSGRYKKNQTYETHDYSQHPGIFVSDTSTSTVTITPAGESTGTSYNKGSIYVKGRDSSTPSTITLDICACREIRTTNYGVVVAKAGSTDWQQYAGLYLTKGSLVEETNGWIQVSHDTTNRYGERHYETGFSDSSAYVPDGNAYVSYFNKQWKTYKKRLGVSYDTQTKTYSQSKSSLTNYYKPKDSPPTPTAPSGIPSGYKPTNVPSTSVNDSSAVRWNEIARKTAPTQPSISATGGLNAGSGDASVSALRVNNSRTAEGKCTATTDDKDVVANTVEAATSSITYAGGKANSNTLVWSSPNYSPSGTSVSHPSAQWTSSVTRHFDKTVTEYWNTRYIPYVWKLPYYDSSDAATPAKRALQGKTFEWENDKKSGDFQLTSWTENEANGTEYYVTKNHYDGSSLSKWAGSIKSWRSNGISGNKLWDWLGFNGCDPDYYFYPDDVKRRSKILIFESGELPYSAFYMNTEDDQTNWDKKQLYYQKYIRGKKQYGWWLGSEDVSYYDVGLIFYACADPANPYTSAAKDLHVVLPQGVATRFYYDSNNTVTVLGNGRVFLYLTSGDTIYFDADASKTSQQGGFFGIGSHTVTSAVYANPVGGLKKVSNTKYEPQLYIIGAGTNIDLIIQDMPFSAVIYMPFGSSDTLYNASSGKKKEYNNFKSLVTNSSFASNYYDGTGATTGVARNKLTLVWNDSANDIKLPRWVYGPVVADNFDYVSGAGSYNLNFKNQYIVPNLGDTTIYDYSTTDNNRRGGKTYSISTFLMNAPGYSNTMLNWEYKSIKVEG